MHEAINENLIREAGKHPDWYARIHDHYSDLVEQAKNNTEQKESIVEGLRTLFEDMIRNDKLVLGGAAPELDSERQPIDTVVIHHTSQKPGLRLERLNVIQLLNIYRPVYQNPKSESDTNLKDRPIASNHFYNGKPVFWGYHWLVRMNGEAERLLPDTAVGWHAGNWDVNCRSIGICLDNDYEKQDPAPEVLQAVKKLVHTEYPHVLDTQIVGHKEITDTICPGSNFTSWKQQLITQ